MKGFEIEVFDNSDHMIGLSNSKVVGVNKCASGKLVTPAKFTGRCLVNDDCCGICSKFFRKITALCHLHVHGRDILLIYIKCQRFNHVFRTIVGKYKKVI